MELKVECPSCSQRISITADQAGSEAQCPVCGDVFDLPPLEEFGVPKMVEAPQMVISPKAREAAERYRQAGRGNPFSIRRLFLKILAGVLFIISFLPFCLVMLTEAGEGMTEGMKGFMLGRALITGVFVVGLWFSVGAGGRALSLICIVLLMLVTWKNPIMLGFELMGVLLCLLPGRSKIWG